MNNFGTSSVNYNVLPIKVQNTDRPWIEICQKGHDYNCEKHDYIIIEPVVAKDPLDIKDPLPIFQREDISEPEQIYGSYIAQQIQDDNVDASIIKVSIACLKNSVSLKHVQSSTFIAMTDLLKHFMTYDRKETELSPYIILNTKCHTDVAPLNSFSDMVREITAAYVNCFYDYPTIFVTFSDYTTLTTDDNIKVSTKKKKKKKNKKK